MKVNLQNDLFLALQELNRQQDSLSDNGYIRLFKSLINNFGIVSVDSDTDFENFQVQGGTNTGTIQIIQDSYAIDSDINIIFQEAIDNIAITDDSNYYWVMVEFNSTSLEIGTIDLGVDGSITGTGTKFTEVLRDQSNYPVKMNFPGSTQNTGDYQVVSIQSDTQATIAGSTGFTSENGLSYQVVGSFTPGISPLGDSRLPYVYDSCTITLVPEVSVDVPPVKTEGTQFYLARVRRVASIITIVDKRTELFSVASTTGGWTQATLLTDFTHVTGQEVEYRVNYLQEVEVRGAFTTTNASGSLFSMPESLRPSYDKYGTFFNGINTQVDNPTIMRVTSGGQVLSINGNWNVGTQNTIINMKYQTE